MSELLYTQEDIDEWIRTCEELQERNRELKQEIAEYKDKIEQGTLIELPCKVGDTVYEVNTVSRKVSTTIARSLGIIIVWKENDLFGRWLFLTREEAEKRLKELKE